MLREYSLQNKMAVRSWIRTAILHVTLVRAVRREHRYTNAHRLCTHSSALIAERGTCLARYSYPRLSLSRATHCPANTQSECPRRTRSVRSPDLRQRRLVHGAFLRIADNLVIAPVVQRIDPLRLAANLSQCADRVRRIIVIRPDDSACPCQRIRYQQTAAADQNDIDRVGTRFHPIYGILQNLRMTASTLPHTASSTASAFVPGHSARPSFTATSVVVSVSPPKMRARVVSL